MNTTVSALGGRAHSGAPDSPGGKTYAVQRGDTLSAIARRHGISLQALLQANPNILNPDVIYPDQQINLPSGDGQRGGDARSTQAPGGAASSAPAQSAATNSGIGGLGVTAAQLQQIVPQLSAGKAAEVAPHLTRAMAEANINTPQRQAMFIAQLAHESGGFRYSEEIWGPTAAQRGYEGRSDLGNTQPGDGYRFRGRGYIQLTGRHNYTQAGRALGLDLTNNPDLAAQPQHAARVAAWYWNSRNINAAADRGDFTQVTRLINGGTNGLADRTAYYNRARQALGSGGGAPAPSPSPSSPPSPGGGTYTVRSGDTMSAIAARHGVSLSALIRANPNIRNPDLIYPGQTLSIPGGGGNGSSSNGGSYTIRSGDTMSGIAARHGIGLDALIRANPNIRNPDLIYPGQTLSIPAGGNGASSGSDGGYTVRSGDTMSGIASRHGVGLNALIQANPNIRDPNLIYPGQSLRIPGGGGNGKGNGGNTGGGSNMPPAPSGNVQTYSPYTVYSTGDRAAIRLSDASQMQPHHDYQSSTRNGQRLEVRDIVLHRDGQSQTNQAVPAPLQGTIIHAGWMGNAGNAVGIQDASGRVAWVFHLSKIDVSVGQRVGYGQDLGNQGSTGNSTGPHVHIEGSPDVVRRWVNDLLDGRFDGRKS